MASYKDSMKRLALFPGAKVVGGAGENFIHLRNGGSSQIGGSGLIGFDTDAYFHIDVSQMACPPGIRDCRENRVALVVRGLAAQIRDFHKDATVSLADCNPNITGAGVINAYALIRFRHGVTVVTGAYVPKRPADDAAGLVYDEIRITIARSHRIDHSLPGISHFPTYHHGQNEK